MKIRLILIFVIFTVEIDSSFSQILHFNSNHNEYLSVQDTSSYSEKIKEADQDYWLAIFPKYNVQIKSYINSCSLDSIYSKGAFRELFLDNRLIYSDSLRSKEYCTTFFELLDERYIFCTPYVNQHFNTCMSIERECSYIIDIENIDFIYKVSFKGEKLVNKVFSFSDIQKMEKSEGLYCITELNLEKQYLELFSDLGVKTRYKLQKLDNPFIK